MSTITVGVRLSPSLHAKLENHAEKALVTKSEIMIAALARYLGCTEDVPLAQRLAEVEAKVEQLQKEINELSC